MPLPKLEKRLPQFLTEEQMKALLRVRSGCSRAGSSTPFTAWRDRLVMELLYGGGLRVSELVGPGLRRLDLGRRVSRG